MGDGTKKIVVKVNAIEKGSFVVDLELAESILIAMFSAETINYLSNIAEVIGGVFLLQKYFKGKKTEEKEAATVIEANNSDNAVIINNSTIISTVNVYNQQPVREAIGKSLAAADQDTAVEGIRIENKKGTSVSIEKKEFKEIFHVDFSCDEISPTEKKEVDNNATLGIYKLAFEKGFVWGFLYKGFKISIPVKGGALMERINEGVRFGKGDKILVKLEIIKRYNAEFNGYENKSYKILEFIDFVQCPVQRRMFD